MTSNPDDRFMMQAAANARGFLQGKRFLLCDRDTKFSRRFRQSLPSGLQVVQTPIQAPNANAHAERFVRSIKEECLDRIIWFGEARVRRAIFEYLEHDHTERSHQGIGNEWLEAPPTIVAEGKVISRERLGGLLRHYERVAA